MTFTEELTYCDGAETAIMTAAQCTVPITDLRASPYNLNWGDSIYAKVSAINNYGQSLYSLEGNGAVILTNPDAPVSVVEDYSTKTESTIGFTWSDGASNGGATIEGYRVSFDQALGTGVFTVLASGIAT